MGTCGSGPARICSRTWDKDAYLNSVAQKFVLSKRSLVNQVQHSHIWKARFQDNVKRQKDNPTATRYVKSLSLAPHRFDSSAKPFSRAVIFFEAYLVTVQQICDEKKHTVEGKEAAAMLASIDEEQCITLGNLADAGEEALDLVRFLDDEAFDTSALAPELHHFLQRIHLLFPQGECYAMASSYTKHILNFLKQPRTIFYNGSAKVIGGPTRITAAILERCMTRLGAWVMLATTVLRAEFPGFEVLQAFGCLSLGNTRRPCSKHPQDWHEDLQRLSNFCNVKTDDVVGEYEDHKPIANKFYNQGGMTTLEAWAKAVEATQSSKRRREGHPSKSLREILYRFGAYGGSTSGVERLFASTCRAAGILRADLSEGLVNDEVQLMTDVDPKLDETLAKGARTIWAKVCGPSRTAGAQRAERLDAGKSRNFKTIGGKLMLAGHIKRRRQEVDELVAAKKPRVSLKTDPVTHQVGSDGWSEAHEKERLFQETKRLTRYMEAMDEGHTLPKEESAGAKEALRMWRDFEHSKAEKYVKAKTRQASARLRVPADLTAGKVFVQPGYDVGDATAFRQALVRFKMQRVYDRLDAKVFIVPDITEPGQRIRWIAMLSGGLVCDAKYLVSGGHAGGSIAFKAAARGKRSIWCSDAFVNAHGEIHRILTTMVRSAISNWRWVPNKAELLAVGSRRTAAGHGGEVVAFVTAAEQRSQETRGKF